MLNVPHFRQQDAQSCVPACARMILAHLGVDYSESLLVKQFRTNRLLGTSPTNAVNGVESLGHHALWFENATIDRLHTFLDSNWPVIIFLQASDLPHGKRGVHALVLVAATTAHLTFLDPTLDIPFTLTLSSFEQAWYAMDNQGMVIWL